MAVLHLEAQVSTDALLKAADQGEVRDRYDALIARRQKGMLTSVEHHELLRLTAQIEAIDAARAEHLANLARVRGISLGALLDELGIRAPDQL